VAYFERDGVRLYYEVHGQGPALLLTHGFSATSQMWRGQIESLARTHSLILWDMRGHGRSASPTENALYSAAHTVADMAALLDHLGHARAVIGGLSLGGYMSLAFHVQHAARVAALLIIDTGPGYRQAEARAQWNDTARAMADAIEAKGAAALRTGSAERAASYHEDYAGLARAGRCMLTQQDAHVMESLPHIEVPALVLAGAQDTPFLAATDYMAAKIPGARKIIVPDAGHAVNLDQPRRFNAAVTDFLATLNAG